MHLRDNRESFKLTAQMQFNNAANQATIINNYAEARDAWNDSFNQINAFIPAYAADAGFANDHMEIIWFRNQLRQLQHVPENPLKHIDGDQMVTVDIMDRELGGEQILNIL